MRAQPNFVILGAIINYYVVALAYKMNTASYTQLMQVLCVTSLTASLPYSQMHSWSSYQLITCSQLKFLYSYTGSTMHSKLI